MIWGEFDLIIATSIGYSMDMVKQESRDKAMNRNVIQFMCSFSSDMHVIGYWSIE